uniref:Uncharacterized protein n=1 Tax=Amphora coffeiformis TaxID=265554 RepID=A0A6S8HNR7_9STRA|mmetsp:Transcript_1320/g.2614  ORF Transcript_1320/g.2614 Transcript_1320/m.2614 type:complete len:554 (+) Transcript_1320:288-1949(+)|eukprot:scaffold45177_cov260-Amphora_coffeaeformis.AAC.4
MNDPTSIMAMESHDIRPDEIPESSSKKSKKKKSSKSSSSSSKLNDSAASLSLVDNEAEAETSKKSSKKKSSKSSSKTKLAVNEESASSLNASQNLGESASEGLSNDATTAKKSKRKSSKKDEASSSSPSNNDIDKVIQLVTGDIWAAGEGATAALEALCELLQVDETRDYLKNRQLALRLGAHLPVVRKMKDFPHDKQIQSLGLQLVRCWGNMPTAPWFELVMVGALERAVHIIMEEGESTPTYSPKLQDSALCLLEQMTIDAIAIKFLVQQKGIDALVHIFQNIPDSAARNRALGGLRAMMKHGGPVGCKAVAEKVNTLLLNLSDADMLASVVELTAEMAATEEAAKPAIQGNIIEGLAHIFRQPAGGELRNKSLEILKAFVSTGGLAGRKAIVERTNWILQNSDDSKLLVPTIELCTELVSKEDTANGFVQSHGVKGLAYAYKLFLEDKPIVPKYAHEALLTVASTGGSAGRQAIVDEDVLESIVEQMQSKPNEAKVQLRGCQMVLALAADQRKAVKESGVLPLISQIFSIHRKEKQTLKVAHLAMDAMVK